MIRIWKGSHGPLIQDLILETWNNEELLLLCPPNLDPNFDFIDLLPEGELKFVGEWEGRAAIQQRSYREYPEKPLFGIFSSGTTGRKLVLYSKRNIESSLQAILSLFNLRSYSAVFCYPQPFHTFGLILGYCQAILYLKTLIAPSGPYSKLSHKTWREWHDRGLMTLGTPTHFKDLVESIKEAAITPRVTYSSIIGAAMVEQDLWLNSKNILNIESPSIGYGATEASPGLTHLAPGVAPLENGEVGQFLPHIGVENLSNAGLEFSGPAVCLAIIQNKTLEFPKSVFIKDILRKREDGVFVYKGRAELILNRGGEKFALEEIESYLREKMHIDAVCVSIPHPRLGEELGILAKSTKERKDEIYQILKQRFGREFDEDLYEDLNELPLNASSKLDRQECKKIMEKKLAASTFNV